MTAHEQQPCECESCCTGDLPVNPFLALRVAYGMLLGEDDFRTMQGNPRGKQMLHSAWLHGPGVVWGYQIGVDGVRNLTASAGLAIDGVGRELLSESTWCLDLRDWVTGLEPPEKECSTRTVHGCLVVEFDCCPGNPVPTLSDPCDINRRHDEYSRILETARISLRHDACPSRWRPYHRVRVLLGLEKVWEDDPAGEEAHAAQHAVVQHPPAERAAALLREFRRLAAKDAAELRPAPDPGGQGYTLFPVLEEDAAVTLARVEIDVRDNDGCCEVLRVRVNGSARTALIPATTIQELTCGLAPGLLHDSGEADAGGPRVIPETVGWNEDATLLTFMVTRPLVAGSVSRRAVAITSLSERGWVDEDFHHVRYDEDTLTVTVTMADRPVNEVIRLIVRGTGETPIFGSGPVVPLAGLAGGPPGTVNDGHDAVLTLPNPLHAALPEEARP
ncbi:hypothetical protein [Longispora albida]|uniref:hypothetical protein n=1 Tax=Longispora albida TaxID=203523 RepID=UPI000381C64A|nr:hypothetical protein [Longispora albida]